MTKKGSQRKKYDKRKNGNNPYGRNGKPQFFAKVIKGVENFLKSPF